MQLPACGVFSLKKQLGALQRSPALGPHHELRSRAPTAELPFLKCPARGCRALSAVADPCGGTATRQMPFGSSPQAVFAWTHSFSLSLQLQHTIPSEQISPETGSSQLCNSSCCCPSEHRQRARTLNCPRRLCSLTAKRIFIQNPGNHNTTCMTMQVTHHRNTTWPFVCFTFLSFFNNKKKYGLLIQDLNFSSTFSNCVHLVLLTPHILL